MVSDADSDPISARFGAAASSTERFRFPELDRLSPAGSHEALVEPALNVGVRWASAAAGAVVNEAQGYPHYLQLMGVTDQRQLSPIRQALISKGLVAAAGRGALQFTVPGYASYVLRRSTANPGDRAPPHDPSEAPPTRAAADPGQPSPPTATKNERP